MKVYTNPHGTSAMHEAGTVRRDEWRVSCQLLLRSDGVRTPWTRMFEDETTAREVFAAAQRDADRPPHPDMAQVLEPRLERRTVWESPWVVPAG